MRLVTPESERARALARWAAYRGLVPPDVLAPPVACHECGAARAAVAEVGEEPGYDAQSCRLCAACLRAALRLLAEAPPAHVYADALEGAGFADAAAWLRRHFPLAAEQ